MNQHIYELKGWHHFQKISASKQIKKLYKSQGRWFQTVDELMQKKLKIDTKKFNPNDKKDIFEVEIAKASVRTFIRFSPESISIHRSVTDKTYRSSGNSKFFPRNVFTTIPHVMLHLPNDPADKGSMHTDSYPYINSSITIWTPLAEYSPGQLILIPGSHIWPKQLKYLVVPSFNNPKTAFQKIIKSFAKFLILKPYAQKGEFLSWDSAVLHQGLTSKTKALNISLVVRLTSEPMMNEATMIYNPYANLNTKNKDLNISSYYKKLRIFVYELKNLNEQKKYKNAESLERYKMVKEYIALKSIKSEQHKHFLSYALTLFGQVMDFGLHDVDSSVFYYASLCLGNQNLTGFMRLLSKGSNEESKNFGKVILEQNPYRQYYFSFYQWLLASSNKEKVIDYSEEYPLLTWNYKNIVLD
jgi:hypothetical protein